MHRKDERKYDQLRQVSLTFDQFSNAPVSVLFELGGTKVLCSVTLQSTVPPFLRGSKTGWLTAEYAMLPAATIQRTVRESSAVKRNGRSVEISRLIGRSLRAMVDLAQLGERTIVVDCDVLCADGSTRTACITAASLALQRAISYWVNIGALRSNNITDHIVAVSVGITNEGQLLLDIDYREDAAITADYNIVCTRSGSLVELQGSAEGKAISWNSFEKIRKLAIQGITQMFTVLEPYYLASSKVTRNTKRAPLFSLQNR